MDGILYGSVLPFSPALCFAPSAACSYFSTLSMWVWSLSTSGLVGCVETVVSCSTVCSTSAIRWSNVSCFLSNVFRAFSTALGCSKEECERVARYVVASA